MRSIVLFAFTILLLINCTSSKKTSNHLHLSKFSFPLLISEAKEIMGLLGIDIRDSIKYDGEIKLFVDDSLSNSYAFFQAEKGFLAIDSNMKTRIYPYPVIHIAKNLDSIIMEIQDTSILMEVYARRVIVHEIAHHLQMTIPTIPHYEKLKLTEQDYINSVDEIEAFAVGAYYYLKRINPDYLATIVSMPARNKRIIWEALINIERIYTAPGSPFVFPNNPLKYKQ